MESPMQSERRQQATVAPQVSDGHGRAATGSEKVQPLHPYRSAAVAQIDNQRLKVPVSKPPESIVAYLRSLRTYLDAKGTARVLGCHRETLYLLIEEMHLPAQKRGRRWRIDPVAFAAWLEATGFAPDATEESEKRLPPAAPQH